MSARVETEKAAGPSEKDKEKDTLPRDELKNGPIQDRSCTDILCCLIFMAFIVVFAGIIIFGIANGDPYKLITTFDFDSMKCGIDPGYEKYSYVYFPKLDITAAKTFAEQGQKGEANVGALGETLQYSTCVSSCPKRTGVVDCMQPSFMKGRDKDQFRDCVWYAAGNNVESSAARYDTSGILGRFCVPSDPALGAMVVGQFTSVFQAALGGVDISGYINDIQQTKDVIFISFGTAFVVGFVYLIVLRLCGGPIVYASLVFSVLGCAGGGYMLFQEAQNLDPTHKDHPYYLYGSYAVWGLAAILVFCIICNWKNIKIGINVMKCTAQFVGGTPQIFIIPPIFTILLAVWIVVFGVSSLFILSIGEVQRNPQVKFLGNVKNPEETTYMWLYTLFGYLWLNAFLIGVAQFVISATAAIWYFTSNSDDNGKGSTIRGFWWAFRYHLGSLAFGSFLIALVQFIRIIFEYYKSKIEKANKGNPIVKALLCITSCCLACLERFIKFISKNAYIQIAITGKSFCPAAWNAFILILKNAMRFGTANAVGFIFNVMGILFIGSLNSVIVYAFLHYIPAYTGLAQNWMVPCIVSGFIGLIIGSMFMSVYSFSSDTILQCFMVDEELDRPDGNRPAIMNQFIEAFNDEKKEE